MHSVKSEIYCPSSKIVYVGYRLILKQKVNDLHSNQIKLKYSGKYPGGRYGNQIQNLQIYSFCGI